MVPWSTIVQRELYSRLLDRKKSIQVITGWLTIGITCCSFAQHVTQRRGSCFPLPIVRDVLAVIMMIFIRRDLSSNGLLTIVCKRLLIRKLEDRFESQSRASRSGIALGVSPLGVSSQVEDHRLEGATIPWPIAIAQGAKQLRQVIGGGHRCLTG